MPFQGGKAVGCTDGTTTWSIGDIVETYKDKGHKFAHAKCVEGGEIKLFIDDHK